MKGAPKVRSDLKITEDMLPWEAEVLLPIVSAVVEGLHEQCDGESSDAEEEADQP